MGTTVFDYWIFNLKYHLQIFEMTQSSEIID